MDTTKIVCLIIIAVLAAIVVVYKWKTMPTEEQKKEAKDFLDKMSEKIIVLIKESLDKAEPDKYLNVEVFISNFLDALEEQAWDMVEAEIVKQFGDSKDYKIIVNLVDRDSVYSIVNSIVKNKNVENTLAVIFEKAFKDKFEKIDKEEEEAKQIADHIENMNIEEETEEEEHLEETFQDNESELPDTVEYDVDNDDTVEAVSDKEWVDVQNITTEFNVATDDIELSTVATDDIIVVNGVNIPADSFVKKED